jgi:hypothetical protein
MNEIVSSDNDVSMRENIKIVDLGRARNKFGNWRRVYARVQGTAT